MISIRPQNIKVTTVVTEKMATEITTFCNLLFMNSNDFNVEETFAALLEYIKKYDRILYSEISLKIYNSYDDNTLEVAENMVGSVLSNIEKLIGYTNSKQYKEEKEKNTTEKKHYIDTEKSLIKIYDHINLAKQQYNGLKQTDDEYEQKFSKSIEPFKENLTKEMNAQLLTLVGIFTALSFLLFGGISSLDNILSGMNKVSLLKLIVICCVWGLGLVNLIFVFLFCISKMTKIAFASSDAPDATIFQKYPIFWWTNYIIVSIMIFALALLGMHRYGLLEWLDKIKLDYTELKCMVIFGVILILIFIAGRSLSKQCKNRE